MSEIVIGADEVGLGCWAGPLVVCALVAPLEWTLKGLNDSKKLSKKRLPIMYDLIQEQAPFISWHLEWRWPEEIDKIGVGRARVEAFEAALMHLGHLHPGADVIVDGDLKFKNLDFPYRSMPKADANVPAVMAASIIAKVERDRWMHTNGDSEFPNYGFINHVGYGTPEHIKALDEHGPCKLHRLSYRPVAEREKNRLTLKSMTPEQRFQHEQRAEMRAVMYAEIREQVRAELLAELAGNVGNRDEDAPRSGVHHHLNDDEVPF